MSATMTDLFSSPELYPVTLNAEAGIVRFTPLSRESYDKTAFLDGFERDGLIEVPLKDLLDYQLDLPPVEIEVRYIFHGAFCCSTLLARYFETRPDYFVLKEPGLLGQLTAFHCGGNDGKDNEYWSQLLALGMRLLTRTFSPRPLLIIIKPSDLVNGIATELLERDLLARAVFLATDLRTFILSVLKWEKRKQLVRRRLEVLQSHAPRFPGLTLVDVANLNDAQAAGFLWTLNTCLCRDLLRNAPARSIALLGDRVADNPRDVLRQVSNSWNLALDDNAITEMLGHPFASLYSKDLSHAFDAESRRNHLEGLTEVFGEEAERAVEWTLNLEQKLGFCLDWPVS